MRNLERSSEYNTWVNMKQRCSNQNRPDYARYGGRGIKVCKRWDNSFLAFYADLGPCPQGMTLERINNSGGYILHNCHWATAKEQANNRRNNIFFTKRGSTKTLKQWCEILELNYKTVWMRIKRGSSIEKALGLDNG